LVKAFRATLEEASTADLICHVWDVSHPNRLEHWASVLDTLETIGAESLPRLTVCNQWDRLDERGRAEAKTLMDQMGETGIKLSAKTGEGLDQLLSALAEFVETSQEESGPGSAPSPDF
jgi:GTP-binding protein HflX